MHMHIDIPELTHIRVIFFGFFFAFSLLFRFGELFLTYQTYSLLTAPVLEGSS